MAADFFDTLIDDPTIRSVLQGNPPRRAHLARPHSILGPLLLVDSYNVAWVRDFNARFTDVRSEQPDLRNACYEWLGIFRPVGHPGMPIFMDIFREGELVEGSEGASEATIAEIDNPGLEDMTRLVVACGRDWARQSAALHAQTVEWTRAQNQLLAKSGKPPLKEPAPEDVVVKECSISSDGPLFEVLFGCGSAFVYWFGGTTGWQGCEIDF